jgi:general secretion pathway protein D
MTYIPTFILLAALALSSSAVMAQQSTNATDKGAAPVVAAAAVVTNAQATPASPANVPAKEQSVAAAASGALEIPQPPPQSTAAQEKPTDVQLAAAAPTPNPAEAAAVISGVGSAGATNGLRLNFRNAPLEKVLNYMSEAAGFVIVLEARPTGKVDIMSDTPVTREEAVNLLNQALKKNGYAAIRNGRTLTIVPKDEAKIHDIPVYIGADPAAIPRTDEIVTQIIPVRFVEVAQLVKDLQPLVSTQTTMTANESGNEIVITDTQANIHKVAEIIKAIDSGAEDVTLVRVFRLNYADPTELSDLLVNLFPDDSRTGGSSAPMQFGGGFGGIRSFFRGGGGPGGGLPGRGGSTGGSTANQNQRIKKRARVVAVPDPRTSSVVVTAARDLMDQIEEVVTELDSNPAKVKKVKVFHVDNADVQQVMQVLQDTFTSTGANNQSRANQNSVLQNRSTQGTTSQTGTGSTRMGGGNRGGGIGSGSFGQ